MKNTKYSLVELLLNDHSNQIIDEMISLYTEEETAYHGTSHNFKCFKAAGIGGGIGAQAYGWGLYFGKDFNIAKGYAGAGNRGGIKQVLFQGKKPEELAFEYDNDVFNRLPKGLTTAKDFIEYAEETIDYLQYEDFEGKDEIIDEYKKFIDIIKDLNVETEDMKYIYTVLLHKGKRPDQYTYLDWDKKETPQDQVDKINNQANKEKLDFQVDTKESPSNVYGKIQGYFLNKGSKWAAKDASLFLLRAGIDGNTHSNGQVRIIFDEKAIEIINVCKN
jgi:hypothetical protein